MAGEENYDSMKSAVMEIVSGHFRPEFINRVDEVVVFHPLGREQIRVITSIQVEYLKQRLRDRDMDLELSESALDLLGDAGFDPVYGARPLKRAIQNGIENRLAQEILSGHFQPGDVIMVEKNGDELVFNKKGSVNVSAA
jgi:ATP-dependent Clp protease ATP-binding subunit ClpB